MCGSVVEIVHLTFVTLITHEALAAVTGSITVTLHGNGAHWVTVTGWERAQDSGMGPQENRRAQEKQVNI